jgi:hypothetical protein
MAGLLYIVEYQQCVLNCRVTWWNVFYNGHRISKEIGSFPWANSEHEQLWHDSKDDVLGDVQQNPHTSVCRISADTGTPQSWDEGHFTVVVLIPTTSKKWNNSYHGIVPTMYIFPDDWKGIHSLWITFVHRWGSISQLWYHQYKKYTLGCNDNPHEVVQSNFQHTFLVNVWCE